MMNWKKVITFGCCTLLLTAFLTACSGASASKESSTNDSVNTAPNSVNSDNSNGFHADSMVLGKVTSINGKEITLALGDMPMGRGMPGGRGGERGNGPRNNKKDKRAQNDVPQRNEIDSKDSDKIPQGDKTDGQTPSDMPQGGEPDDQAPSDMPQGGEPDDQAPRGRGGTFTENGDTLTITVEDESLIQTQNGRETTTGTLADITDDTILMIQYADDNSIHAIIIQNRNMEASPNKDKASNIDGTENTDK